jgi:murein DD-endopeptidase MepM/ murein hydrolase activator NlpD
MNCFIKFKKTKNNFSPDKEKTNIFYQTTKKILFSFFVLSKKTTDILFRQVTIPAYKVYYRIKKIGKNSFKINKKYNLFHFFIFAISLLVFTHNIADHKVLAEDLGRGSIMYALAQGNEFSEIEEKAIPNTGDDSNSLLDNLLNKETATKEVASVGPKKIMDDSIGRNTQFVAKNNSLENNLRSDNASGINSDTLVKQGTPETNNMPKPRAEILVYTIQSGDTFSSIAKRFGVSINTILWENNLSGLSIIRPGQKINVLPVSGIAHTVVKNDTLGAIAQKYDVEEDEILDYNNLVSADQLQISQKVIIPGGSKKIAQQTIKKTAPVYSNQAPAVTSKVSKNPGKYIWPTVRKTITQYYHWKHHGLDVGSPQGLAIYASMSGKVTHAGWGTGYGNYVDITHPNGSKTRYAHMSKILVKNGDQVDQGHVIGLIGNTGWSTGPHIHFEIIINGKKVNPLSYLTY